MFPNTMNLRG